MAEISDYINYSEKGEGHVEMVVEIYDSVDAVKDHKPTVETDAVDVKNIQSQPTADNTSAVAKYEDIYANDLPRTRVTRSNEGNKKSGVYRLAAVCVLLLFVFLLTAVTVLWVKLVTERNLNKQLKQERDQLQDLSEQLKQEKHEIQNMSNSLDMQDKLKWKRFGSSLYYFSDLKNWTESRQDCIERGTDLVIINSKEKQDFIVEELQGSRKWIGLSDREEEGTWKWVDGTLLTNGHWGYSQPDNKGKEDCAEIGLPESHNWNDRPCFEKQGWICEKRSDL